MKYLKTFEGIDRYARDTTYKYLDEGDAIKVKEFAKSFIDSLNIFDKIDNLKLADFEDNGIDYFLIFEVFFSNNSYNSINNIFHAVDTYCQDNNIPSAGPALRNSLGDIITKIYKEYNKRGLKKKLDEKLISLLEAKPKKYKEIFLVYGDDMNDEVKRACEWMLDFKKFNL